jgi:hypothetical protein
MAPFSRFLGLASLLLASGLASRAQSFFTGATPSYLVPAWRGTAATEFSSWDVFYSPFGDPSLADDGLNYPDKAAPNGIRDRASVLGFTPPANSAPPDPFAFWHLANPSFRQTEPGAFIIEGSGNIYSFAGVTRFELADTTPYAQAASCSSGRPRGSSSISPRSN